MKHGLAVALLCGVLFWVGCADTQGKTLPGEDAPGAGMADGEQQEGTDTASSNNVSAPDAGANGETTRAPFPFFDADVPVHWRALGFSSGQLKASGHGYELRTATGTPFEIQTLDAASGDWRLRAGHYFP